MKETTRALISIADGSQTVFIPELNITYHSCYGAVQESLHVYINAGLHYLRQHQPQEVINILEMGLGTGLNALLTLEEAQKEKQKIVYSSTREHMTK